MSVLNFSSESALRIGKVRAQMAEAQLDAVLIADNANIYYTTGAMFRGYVYIPADGQPLIFVIRPIDLTGDDVVNIRKPEQITAACQKEVWHCLACSDWSWMTYLIPMLSVCARLWGRIVFAIARH